MLENKRKFNMTKQMSGIFNLIHNSFKSDNTLDQ